MKRILLFTIFAIILYSCYPISTAPTKVSEMPVQTQTPSLVPTQTIFPTETALPIHTNFQGGQIFINCHNSLSDAAVINAAITNSAVGDEIVISGQCLVDQTIKLLGDRSYRGTSRTGTVLKQADGANLVALLASNGFLENSQWTDSPVSIRQMTLDGNSQMNQQTPTDGIILRSWLSVVDDMFIRDVSQDGIMLAYQSADGTKLTTSQVNGRISANLIDHSGRYGVYVEFGVTDWNLLDNWIGFSGADGLHLEDAAGWVVERNHIYGVPQNAIYAEHLFTTSISDNIIEGFGETNQAGTWCGIYATVQGEATSTIANNRIYNMVFDTSNPNNNDEVLNFFQNNQKNPASIYRYIALTVNYETGVVSVTGNVIRGMGTTNETGLYYIGGNHQLIITSFGNNVVDVLESRFVDNSVMLVEGY